MIMHSIKYQSTALLQKLLHRGIVMLWTHYKEYFKTAFCDVLEWREDIDTQNKNGPRVSESMKIHLCFLHVPSYPCSSNWGCTKYLATEAAVGWPACNQPVHWLCVDICISIEAQGWLWRKTGAASPLSKGRKLYGNTLLQILLHNPCFLRSERLQFPDFLLQRKTSVADTWSQQKTAFHNPCFG